MGSVMGMSAVQLMLVVFSCLISPSSGFPLKVLSAPNLLRVGTEENIFVEIQDCESEDDIPVEIVALSYPAKAKQLTSTLVTLTKAGKFQNLGRITIPADEFKAEPNIKQYVYLQAHFPDHLLEKIVLVSFQSGYIFIQTDKTIYTPNSNVNYRLFAIRPGMEPVDPVSQSKVDTSVNIQIVTPDGATLQSDFFNFKSGIHSGTYKLGELVSTGIWKVIAKFSSNIHESFVSEFEVKEYVLPSFEVELKPVNPCFYVDSKELKVDIEATYTFGKKVDGSAYVVFGVVHENQKKSISDSLQRVPIVGGKGEAKITKENIKTIEDINRLVGETIFIKASVLTENGGELVEIELGGIKIVTSPYTISFKKTPKYFKPGMSFDVTVEVLNPDDTPAGGVAVVVDPGAVEAFSAANGLARLSINTAGSSESLIIQARTNVPQISSERQASANMTASPFKKEGNNYIHISVDTTLVNLGTNMKINLFLKGQEDGQNDITCLVFSRGQLVQHKRYRREGQSLITMILPITKDLLPSFRLVAYHHPNSHEVVSDSLWVDVEDSCMGSLKLSSKTTSYKPRQKLGLKITGDPGATVGLVAVDKGVYILNNKYRLTQKKIWDVVEKYDTGCSPGGGNNSMNVFYDAGLLFKTNTAFETPYRTDLKCESHHRQKRAATISEVITQLVNAYGETEKLKRECCLDGMKDIPVSYTCARRSKYILDGPDCVAAFLHCCNEIQKEQAKRREEILHLARSEADDFHMSNQITTRTNFPESWLWYNITMNCSKEEPNCDSAVFEKDYPLPDSITTWLLTGISLSRTHGICVAKPLEITVEKTFFIDLRLPYSAVCGEQLEIKAILHNYNDDPVNVRVDLLEEKDVCSAAYKKYRFRQQVRVGAQTTRAVPFIIIPLKEGNVKITLKAVVTDADSNLSDGIEKKLRVVPRGVLVKSIRNVILAPAEKGVGGRQDETINSEIPQTEFVPKTPLNTHIFVTGREQMSALLENAISGNSMGTLIKAPGGCGEQNMIIMTLPVIATLYLDKTNQWEAVGFQKRAEALQHIRTGYNNEFAYRKSDGGFAVFPEHLSGTWLTAYVAKVFSIAHGLVEVDKEVICGAIQFLIVKAQNLYGMFKEVGYMIHFEMIGDVAGKDSDASMTAFCLIAMQESRVICSDIGDNLKNSIHKSVTYLEQHLPQLTNPYAVAITSYALANENKLNKTILFQFAAPDKSHWPSSTTHENTLEATAYALLALVKHRAFTEAKPIVRWLSQQQKSEGGYGSTQATIMVYQAVAEYWASAEEPEYDLKVDISLPGRSNLLKYTFRKENHFTTKSNKFQGINKDIKITATGTGEATLKVVSLYYAMLKKDENDCKMFNLTLTLTPETINDDKSTYRLTIEFFFKSRDRNTTMSVLDIGLPTGFGFDKDDLHKMSKGASRLFSRYEFNKILSDKGSLIIYLDKVSNTEPEMISFRIHQEVKVGVLQPAAVSIYEYYDKKPCVKFYRPGQETGEMSRLCKGQECTCAEENCSMQNKEKMNNDERTMKACEVSSTHKIDFVYKVRVEDFADDLSTDIYTVRVLSVIKEGTDLAPQGKLRTFLGFHHCRDALSLKQGKTYLIMGSSTDIYKDEQKQLFQYVLGENTWIEYWPSTEECHMDKYRSSCMGMEELTEQLEVFGCEMK
ncbi:complement C3-like [Anableps anableps]